MPTYNPTIYTGKHYVGQLGDNGPRVTQTGTLESGPAAYGVGVMPGVKDGSVKPAGAAKLYGIVRRHNMLEALNRPSDGSVSYKEGDEVGVLRDGYIYVETDAPVARGDAMKVDPATGEFKAGGTATTNVFATASSFLDHGKYLTRVRITLAD